MNTLSIDIIITKYTCQKIIETAKITIVAIRRHAKLKGKTEISFIFPEKNSSEYNNLKKRNTSSLNEMQNFTKI